jgi:hypothetical protein
MKYVVIALSFFLSFFAGMQAIKANAQSYEIRVRQIEPDGPLSEATCEVSQTAPCLVPLAAGDDSNLDIGMQVKQGKLNFNFLWERDYAYIKTYQMREEGFDLLLDEKGQGYAQLLLSTRGIMHQGDPNILSVWPPSWMLAHIEIGVRRTPNSTPE